MIDQETLGAAIGYVNQHGGGYVLPTATASRLGGVKIGSGINVEEDGTISAGGGNLTAGDYISIENDEINVKMKKGDLTEYQYKLYNNTSTVTLTIEKYIEDILVESNTYQNDTLYTPLVVDDRLQVSYSPGWPDRYCWIYTLLTDSKEHAKDDRIVWYYTTAETHIETFDVEDDATTLIRKGDLDYANLPNKPSINGVSLSGNKTTSDLGINADNVMLSDGVTSVENVIDELTTEWTLIKHNGAYNEGWINYDFSTKKEIAVRLSNLNGFCTLWTANIAMLKNDENYYNQILGSDSSDVSKLKICRFYYTSTKYKFVGFNTNDTFSVWVK